MNNNFSYLKDHIGRQVRVDRGGPESQEGRLLGLEKDLLILKSKDNVVYYYQTSHLKSITLDSKEELNMAQENWVVNFVEGSTLHSVLEELKYTWVQINRGGPEKVEGVLSEVENDHLILVKNEELIHISLFHIKSVSSPQDSQNTDQEEQNVTNGNENEKEMTGNSSQDSMKIYALSAPPSLRRYSSKWKGIVK